MHISIPYFVDENAVFKISMYIEIYSDLVVIRAAEIYEVHCTGDSHQNMHQQRNG